MASALSLPGDAYVLRERPEVIYAICPDRQGTSSSAARVPRADDLGPGAPVGQPSHDRDSHVLAVRAEVEAAQTRLRRFR
jgi:hypothetical protein